MKVSIFQLCAIQADNGNMFSSNKSKPGRSSGNKFSIFRIIIIASVSQMSTEGRVDRLFAKVPIDNQCTDRPNYYYYYYYYIYSVSKSSLHQLVAWIPPILISLEIIYLFYFPRFPLVYSNIWWTWPVPLADTQVMDSRAYIFRSSSFQVQNNTCNV